MKNARQAKILEIIEKHEIGTQEELWPAYEELRKKFRCICAKDTYSEDFWLEVMPWHATKADAILQLKTLFGFEKVVVFGDAVNDISMFEVTKNSFVRSRFNSPTLIPQFDINSHHENINYLVIMTSSSGIFYFSLIKMQEKHMTSTSVVCLFCSSLVSRHMQ